MRSQTIFSFAVFFLFVIGAILITFERPTWYYSIPLFMIVILIILLKIIWNISGWANNVFERYLGSEDKFEITFKDDDEKKDGKEK